VKALKSKSEDDVVSERKAINMSQKLELEANLRAIRAKELDDHRSGASALKNDLLMSTSLAKGRLQEDILLKKISKHPPTANILPFTSSKV